MDGNSNQATWIQVTKCTFFTDSLTCELGTWKFMKSTQLQVPWLCTRPLVCRLESVCIFCVCLVSVFMAQKWSPSFRPRVMFNAFLLQWMSGRWDWALTFLKGRKEGVDDLWTKDGHSEIFFGWRRTGGRSHEGGKEVGEWRVHGFQPHGFYKLLLLGRREPHWMISCTASFWVELPRTGSEHTFFKEWWEQVGIWHPW